MKRDSDPGAATARVDLAVEPVAAVRLAPLASLGADQAVAVSKPGPPPANKPKLFFLRLYRWQAPATLVVLIGAGALAVRWWHGPSSAGRNATDMDFLDD